MVTNPLKGQKVYVDANSLIYAIETPQLFPGLRTQFVQTFLQGDLTIATSWITLAEVLVKPLNQGDLKLESYYRRLIRPSQSFTVVAVNEYVSSAAATIRAQYGLRLPDAIHIASGQLSGCTCFLSRDSEWSKLGITVIDPTSL